MHQHYIVNINGRRNIRILCEKCIRVPPPPLSYNFKKLPFFALSAIAFRFHVKPFFLFTKIALRKARFHSFHIIHTHILDDDK